MSDTYARAPQRREPLSWPVARIAVGLAAIAAAFIPEIGLRALAEAVIVMAALFVGYYTLWLSRLSDEERILVWLRGRGGSGLAVDLVEGLHLGSASIYPTLQRMEQAGTLTSRWEGDQPFAPHEPRRRIYSVVS